MPGSEFDDEEAIDAVLKEDYELNSLTDAITKRLTTAKLKALTRDPYYNSLFDRLKSNQADSFMIEITTKEINRLKRQAEIRAINAAENGTAESELKKLEEEQLCEEQSRNNSAVLTEYNHRIQQPKPSLVKSLGSGKNWCWWKFLAFCTERCRGTHTEEMLGIELETPMLSQYDNQNRASPTEAISRANQSWKDKCSIM